MFFPALGAAGLFHFGHSGGDVAVSVVVWICVSLRVVEIEHS